MIFCVRPRILPSVLTFGIAASALVLASCSTTESRISGHPEIYQSLSPRDQALVSQGQIRDGMLPNAVYWLGARLENCGHMRVAPPRPDLGITRPTLSVLIPTMDPFGLIMIGFTTWSRGRHHRTMVAASCSLAVPLRSILYSIPPSIPYPYKVVTSPMEGLYLSSSWCRRIFVGKFCRVRIKNASV
jgi:hypothetical protein